MRFPKRVELDTGDILTNEDGERLYVVKSILDGASFYRAADWIAWLEHEKLDANVTINRLTQ